jgi:hypothetical protein
LAKAGVKKGIFAKRTQIENHKTLPISRMRKHGLASFSKRTHFPFCGLDGSSIFNQNPAQAYSRLFKAIQTYSRVLGKKGLFFLGFVPWWFQSALSEAPNVTAKAYRKPTDSSLCKV